MQLLRVAALLLIIAGISATDLVGDLKDLRDLHESNALSDVQYEAAKDEVIRRSVDGGGVVGCPAAAVDTKEGGSVMPRPVRELQEETGAPAGLASANVWLKSDNARIVMGSTATTSISRGAGGELISGSRILSPFSIVWEDPNAGNKEDFKQQPFHALWNQEGGAAICPIHSSGGNYCFIHTDEDPTRIVYKLYLQNAEEISYKFRLGNFQDTATRVHRIDMSYDFENWSEVSGDSSFGAEVDLKEGAITLPVPDGVGMRFTGVVFIRASCSGHTGTALVGWDRIRLGCGAPGCENFFVLPAGGAGGMGGGLTAGAAEDAECDVQGAAQGRIRWRADDQALEVCTAEGDWVAVADANGDPCSVSMPNTKTFTFTGDHQYWTVPEGKACIRVFVWGAGGGGGGHRNNHAVGGDGGGGAAVDAYILVEGGHEMRMMVGQSLACVSNTINGFSYGGGASCGGNINQRTAGYGGGGSRIHRTSPTDSVLVVAGGGGGGNNVWSNPNGDTPQVGGAGGGEVGGSGSGDGTPPTGGTQSAGGTKGTGVNQNGSSCQEQTDGQKWKGGRAKGANGCDVGYASGGGGGGGWYGGGGGSGGAPHKTAQSGAGGSSYVNPNKDLVPTYTFHPGAGKNPGMNGQTPHDGVAGTGGSGVTDNHGVAGQHGLIVVKY